MRRLCHFRHQDGCIYRRGHRKSQRRQANLRHGKFIGRNRLQVFRDPEFIRGFYRGNDRRITRRNGAIIRHAFSDQRLKSYCHHGEGSEEHANQSYVIQEHTTLATGMPRQLFQRIALKVRDSGRNQDFQYLSGLLKKRRSGGYCASWLFFTNPLKREINRR